MFRWLHVAPWLVMILIVASGCLPPEQPTLIPSITPGEGYEPLLTETADDSPSLDEAQIATLNTAQDTPGPGQAPLEDIAIKSAINQLSGELNIDVSAISLDSMPLPVQWSDSSLGCPEPGVTYAQVITPGYLIELSTGGLTYEVHTDLNGRAVICTNQGDPIGQGTVSDPIVAEFITQIQTNLAQELGVSPADIILVRSEAVEWSDSSLGCPEPGQTYVQVITPGYRIVMAVEETRYQYHADQQRFLRCDNPSE